MLQSLKVSSDTIHVRVDGYLSTSEIQNLVFQLEDLIQQQGKICILVELIQFSGIAPSALWNDLRFTVSHLQDIERYAVVGDQPWLQGWINLVKLMVDPFRAAETRYFKRQDLATAQQWLQSRPLRSKTVRASPANDITQVWEELVWDQGGKIIYLILDGLGGLPDPQRGETELQVANTLHLDQLARDSSCGLLEMVGPGITPGSGPGHLTLFGYDPLQYRIGRGVLSALGIGFDLQEGDVAARVNFATLDAQGNVCDRRAGRLSTEHNQRLCQKIKDRVHLGFEGDYFFMTVSEHRAVLVLRGHNLGGQLQDTDPQQVGMAPLSPMANTEASQPTAEIVESFIDQVNQVLADEYPANTILLRGFEQYRPLPSLADRFKLKGLCIADYPMYRGVSRLIGMDVVPPPGGLEARFQALSHAFGEDYNFYFLHVKKSDSRGEDGDFDAKVAAIEAFDQLLPQVLALQPDVIVVASDHSTPATLGSHSWHPIPFLIHAPHVRVDAVDRFDEYACAQGSLGLRPGLDLMGLALANAGKLRKYGA